MELLTGLLLLLLHAGAIYALLRFGRLVRASKGPRYLKVLFIALGAAALTALTVLADFLLVLGLLRSCQRFTPRGAEAACDGISAFHVVFVFTSLLPLLSLGQAAGWGLRRSRPARASKA